MKTSAWGKYMRLATRDNDTTVARRLGVSVSTVGRWRSGEIDPKPRQVVAFAREYDRNPISALIAAEYLDTNDIVEDGAYGIRSSLDDVSTRALLDELDFRVTMMNDYIGMIKAIGQGEDSVVRISADSLRYIDPASSPTDEDGEAFLNAIADRLEEVEGPSEGPYFKLAKPASNVIVGGFGNNVEPSEDRRAARKRSKDRGEETFD